jgi:hypothetical protein
MNAHRHRPCPNLDDVLLAVEGVLPPEVDESVSTHIGECVECQRRIRQAQLSVDSRFLDSATHGEDTASTPCDQRAGEWHDRGVLNTLDERERSRADQAGIGWTIRRGLSAAAAMIAFLVTLLFSPTHSVIVDANELVQLVARAERAHRMPHTDGARFRFTPDTVGEPFNTVQEFGSNPAPDATPSGVPPALARVLASYHFEWRQPLSVERFVAWRTSHACSRQDRVVRRASDGLLVLSTTVLDGELREVELKLDAETYRVLNQTLVFQGVGRLEIEALAQGTPSYAPTRTSPSPVVAVASRRPNRDELDRAELHARLVLGHTGLDMRGNVRVSRTPEAVRVEGTLASPGQHRGAGKQLAAIKHVQVDLHVGNLSNTSATQGVVRTVTAKPGLGRWVNRTFDDPAARGSFVTGLTFDRHRSATSRAALRVGETLSQCARPAVAGRTRPVPTVGRSALRKFARRDGRVEDARLGPRRNGPGGARGSRPTVRLYRLRSRSPPARNRAGTRGADPAHAQECDSHRTASRRHGVRGALGGGARTQGALMCRRDDLPIQGA